MKPENTQNAVPMYEQAPTAPLTGFESVPVLPMPEAAPLGGQERYEQTAEARAQVANAAPAAPVIVPVIPATPQVNQVASDDTTTQIPVPMVAADEDLIEKEWVDKAKEIILQTKDDPHARTNKVNELQRTYLQKRFGKVVGAGE